MSVTVNVIPQLVCFGPRCFKLQDAHSQTPLAKMIKSVYNSLRSIDGLDEAGSAGGQTLPGIAAPIFTASFLGIASPIVAIGAAGAFNESVDRFRDYPGRLRELSASQQKIIDLAHQSISAQHGHGGKAQRTYLASLTATSRRFDQYKKNRHDHLIFGKNPFSQPNSAVSRRFLTTAQAWRQASLAPSPELLHEIKQYQLLDAHRHIQQSDRNASVVGAAAMIGMTAGMLVSTASSAASIAAQANVVAAEPVADSLLTAAGALFLPAQTAMLAYGASKVASGVRVKRQLKQDRKVLETHTLTREASTPGTTSLSQLLQRKARYENQKISYGTATAVGQACMIAGNLTSLSGAGALAAIPLFAVGAPLTLGAAIQRIVYERREKNFAGDGASSTAWEKSKQHKLAVLLKMGSLTTALPVIEGKYADHSQSVARTKLFSLIDHVLGIEEKKRNPSVAAAPVPKHREQRQQRLEKMLQTGRKSWLRGTSLLKGDVLMMSKIWEELPNKDGILAGSPIEIRKWMAQEFAQDDASPVLDEKQQGKVLRQTITGLIQSSKGKQASEIRGYLRDRARSDNGINLADVLQFVNKNDQANMIYHRSLSRTLIKQRKTDSKFMRHDAAQELLKAMHSQVEIDQQINQSENV